MDKFLHQFINRRIYQRFAAGDGNHWRTAVRYRVQAFLQGQHLPQGLPVFLNPAAAGATEIAHMRGLEHQYQREFLLTLPMLFSQIGHQGQVEAGRETHNYFSFI
jgi:hypothetical protein